MNYKEESEWPPIILVAPYARPSRYLHPLAPDPILAIQKRKDAKEEVSFTRRTASAAFALLAHFVHRVPFALGLVPSSFGVPLGLGRSTTFDGL